MKILYAAAEVAPFVKVGGLADVAGSLPKAINKLSGNEIRVILPLYGSIDPVQHKIENVPNSSTTIYLGHRDIHVSLKKTMLPNSDVIVYFVENEEYFGSHRDVYPNYVDPAFEHERFLVFGKAVLELMQKVDFKPDVINCNDWHTANIPIFLRTHFKDCDFYKACATVLSIHNLAYQGRFNPEILNFAHFDHDEYFKDGALEYWGDVNWLKGGIVFSEQINTVSEKYAKEIQTPEYGFGLDGLLREHQDKLTGILNGIDYSVWNPQTDKIIPENFSVNNLRGKVACKKSIQRQFGLPTKVGTVPMIGIISRLVDQKGFDIIANVMEELKDMNVQLVVLGTGDERYEKMFRHYNDTSDNIRASIGFDSMMAERIYAASDMFLMPSKFEPCGLGQIIAMAFGSVPVVRATGGLADTVVDHQEKNRGPANGFVFSNYDHLSLMGTIKRAVDTFKKKKEWEKLVKNALSYNFSWERSANRYLGIYKEAKDIKTGR